MKKRYYFTASVESVYGHQMYSVDAESEEAAYEEVTNGGGVFISEELEVQDLSDYSLDRVEEIPE